MWNMEALHLVIEGCADRNIHLTRAQAVRRIVARDKPSMRIARDEMTRSRSM